MNWKFWNKDKKGKKDSQIQALQEEVTNLNTQLESLNDQIKKMTRMQLKSSKNMEDKLDDFESTLTSLNKQHDLIQRYEKDHYSAREQMIRLVDEFDHVSSGIKETDQGWWTLLDQWSAMIEKSLEEMGVHQLHVMGKTFNPEIAESLKTVAKDSLSKPSVVPYQIVEVLRRGYVSGNGSLIRKAQVVTIREEDKYEQRIFE